jgi:hypothetical protein
MSHIKKNFNLFVEGIKIGDLGSIPGKGPGERDYLGDVSARAKARMGIERETEGSMGSIGPVINSLMSELSRSQRLSSGHEKELEDLATSVIKQQFGPLLDYYGIKLDIKMSSGREIRRFIDRGYSEEAPRGQGEKTPVVRARGVDFSMLIHEAVKGIWRVISMSSVPRDPEIAAAVESQFELMDEPEDWRYGPEIAADLRDFVNQNPKVEKYQNVREEVWIYMIDERKMPTEEFLKFMKGILSNTPEARKKMDEIIDIIVEKLEKREKYLRDLKEYEFKMKEYERKMEEYNRMTSQQPSVIPTGPEPVKDSEPDYSKMSQKELNDALSQALDKRDFATVEKISKYLK